MNGSRTDRIRTIKAALVVVFLASFLLTGACSKKETPPGQKPAGAESKEGTGGASARHGSEHPEGTVELTQEGMKMAGVEVAPAIEVASSDLVGATAVIELNGDRVSRVNPRVTGRCVGVKGSLGDRVRAGQTLAQIDSVEMDQAWSDYIKARAQLDLARRSVKREETLFEKKVSPEKDLLKARQELSQAEADMLLAKEKFRILGVDTSRVVSDGDGTTHYHPLISVSAPLSGVIMEKTVTQGEMVGPEKTLFTIADLSTLWLMVDIYERDIGRVKRGMQVKVTTSAYPGKEFRGKISYIGDLVDEKSRTVKARVTIDNTPGFLKPGMFVSSSIDSAGDPRGKKRIVLPQEAVYLDGSDRYVFLSRGNGRFEAKEVVTGASAGNGVDIEAGIKAGDLVAVKGVFALKSELKKGGIEDEHGH
jgi:cobalt-zinc-cadmium efflux system membrane fusion protein